MNLDELQASVDTWTRDTAAARQVAKVELLCE